MSGLEIHPLTPDRWTDFETVMGPKGGCGGCWCMLWRLRKRDYDANVGSGNREAMRALVEAGEEPGLLAYDGGQPIGWISVAPRCQFPRLEGSRVLKPVDAVEVWSVSCLLVVKNRRRRGVATALLEAACTYVAARGGRVVEGYPVAPAKVPYPPVYAWTGFAEVFSRAGFETVAQRSPTRPIMRREVSA